MARKPRAPFDPSKLSDRPGSITPAQFAILTRLGTLLPTRKQQGKMYRVTDLSQREASLLLGQVSASRGEARATAAQIKYLYALGAMFPDDITKAEASALIQQMKSHAIPNRRTNGKLVWVSNHPFYGNKRKHFTAKGQGGEFLVQPVSRGGGWSVSWSDRTHTANIGYHATLADAKRAAEATVIG